MDLAKLSAGLEFKLAESRFWNLARRGLAQTGPGRFDDFRAQIARLSAPAQREQHEREFAGRLQRVGIHIAKRFNAQFQGIFQVAGSSVPMPDFAVAETNRELHGGGNLRLILELVLHARRTPIQHLEHGHLVGISVAGAREHLLNECEDIPGFLRFSFRRLTLSLFSPGIQISALCLLLRPQTLLVGQSFRIHSANGLPGADQDTRQRAR